jgi:hypothetical protein
MNNPYPIANHPFYQLCTTRPLGSGTNLRSNNNEQEAPPSSPEPNKVKILTHVKEEQSIV